MDSYFTTKAKCYQTIILIHSAKHVLLEPIQQNLRFAIKRTTGSILIYVIFAMAQLGIIAKEIMEKIILVTQEHLGVL